MKAIEIPEYPSLEELLWAMNGMKKCKVFSKNKTKFTKNGAILYKRLIQIIYGVHTLVTAGEITVNDSKNISPKDIEDTLNLIVENEV